MLDPHFVILGALLNIIGSTGYIIDTVRGKTRPNRISWLLWALAPLVAFGAELNKGVGLPSLMTFMIGFGPLMVFIASFANKKSHWRFTALDWACGALSLLALGLWAITREGNIAILFSILTDALAGVPTLIKAYREPESESGGVFLFGAASALITLLTIRDWNFATWGFPAYIFVICMLIFALVAYPRKKEVLA